MFAMNNSENHAVVIWREGRVESLVHGRRSHWYGVLTREDLQQIARNHHFGREINLKYHVGLPHWHREGIKIAYLNRFVRPYFPEAVLSDVRIDGYYGHYKVAPTSPVWLNRIFGMEPSSVAVRVSSRFCEFSEEESEVTVGGVTFRYSGGNEILIATVAHTASWFNPRIRYIYTKQEAYNRGHLSRECLQSIAYYHENGATVCLDW